MASADVPAAGSQTKVMQQPDERGNQGKGAGSCVSPLAHDREDMPGFSSTTGIASPGDSNPTRSSPCGQPTLDDCMASYGNCDQANKHSYHKMWFVRNSTCSDDIGSASDGGRCEQTPSETLETPNSINVDTVPPDAPIRDVLSRPLGTLDTDILTEHGLRQESQAELIQLQDLKLLVKSLLEQNLRLKAGESETPGCATQWPVLHRVHCSYEQRDTSFIDVPF